LVKVLGPARSFKVAAISNGIKAEPAVVKTAVRYAIEGGTPGSPTIVAPGMASARFEVMNGRIRAELQAAHDAGKILWFDVPANQEQAHQGLTAQLANALGAQQGDLPWGFRSGSGAAGSYTGALLNNLATAGRLTNERPVVISYLGYDAQVSYGPADRALEDFYAMQTSLKGGAAGEKVRLLFSTAFTPRRLEGTFVRSQGSDFVVEPK
jgi:hypothetical protein